MATPKNYETGMRVVFDEKSKTVSVVFRGRRHELKGPLKACTRALRPVKIIVGSLDGIVLHRTHVQAAAS
jgi:hypothetical protein